MAKIIEIKCVHCGYFLLTDEYQGPCPKCGKEGRARKVIGDDYVLSVSSTYSYKFIDEYYKNNKRVQKNLIIFNALLLLLNLLLSGFVGFIFGAMIFILSYIFTPYAVISLGEIRSGQKG